MSCFNPNWIAQYDSPIGHFIEILSGVLSLFGTLQTGGAISMGAEQSRRQSFSVPGRLAPLKNSKEQLTGICSYKPHLFNIPKTVTFTETCIAHEMFILYFLKSFV
jgi:hypothetical protein